MGRRESASSEAIKDKYTQRHERLFGEKKGNGGQHDKLLSEMVLGSNED